MVPWVHAFFKVGKEKTKTSCLGQRIPDFAIFCYGVKTQTSHLQVGFGSILSKLNSTKTNIENLQYLWLPKVRKLQ